MSFFNSLATPVGYGAIMYNGNPDALVSCYPLFTSMHSFAALTSISGFGVGGTVSINDVDDYFTVMPGYRIIVYNDLAYGGTVLLTGDNTNGVVPVNYKVPSPNQATSIKLFFKGTLIDRQEPAVTASNFASTYNLSSGSTYYRVYEFYTGSTGTFSFTGGSTVYDIQCLLIGGGGGGGMYKTGGATAAGAGGAGTFLTTSVNAIPGSTFTVTVGAGGAGAAVNTTNAGSAGSPTSITRTVGGVVDAALNVGGGGGGGALSSTTGTIGAIYGSTGGTGGIAASGTTNALVASTAVNVAYTVTSESSLFTNIAAFANTGGNSSHTGGGGGGGGAGGTGGNASGNYPGGAGGAGKAWTVTGSRLFAGGGGGVNSTLGGTAGAAGSGGGGSFANPVVIAVIENTGSGGASAITTIAAGKGASGICIIAIPI